MHTLGRGWVEAEGKIGHYKLALPPGVHKDMCSSDGGLHREARFTPFRLCAGMHELVMGCLCLGQRQGRGFGLALFPPSVHTLVDSSGLPFSEEQCPSKSG